MAKSSSGPSPRNRFEEYLKENKPAGYKVYVKTKKKALEEGNDVFKMLRDQISVASGTEKAVAFWLNAIGKRLVEPDEEDVAYLRTALASEGMNLDTLAEVLGGDRKKIADIVCMLNIDKLLSNDAAYMIVGKLVMGPKGVSRPEAAQDSEGPMYVPPAPGRMFLDEIPARLLKLKPDAFEQLKRYGIEEFQREFARDFEGARKALEERILSEESAEKKEIFRQILKYYAELDLLEIPGIHSEIIDEDTGETVPFPAVHQKIGARFIAEKKRALIADEMGLGKTAMAIIAKNLLEEREGMHISAVVVAPNNVISQWKRQVAKWNVDKKSVVVIRSGDKEEKIAKAVEERPDFVILSYDMVFRQYGDTTVGDALRGVSEYLILDEIHNAKEAKGVRSRQIQEMSRRAEYVAMLSGTPVPNRIKDMGIIAAILWDHKISPEEFNARYGKSPRVVREMILPYMLRRKKKDTFQSKGCQVNVVRVPMGDEQKRKYGKLMLGQAGISSLKMLSDLRKCALDPGLVGIDEESEKYNKLVEMLKEHEDGSPAVVFSSELKDGVLNRLEKRLKAEGLRVARIDGDPKRSGRKRQKILDDYEKGEYDVLIATLKTLGEGVDQLTVGHRGYFLDVPFTDARLAQGITRLDRKGQHRPVDIHILVSEDSIDEMLLELIEKKRMLAEFLLDGHELTEEEKKILESKETMVSAGTDPLKKLYRFFGMTTNRRIGDVTWLLKDPEIGGFVARQTWENFEGSFYGNVTNLIVQTIQGMEASGRRFDSILDVASGPCCLARTLKRPITSLDANPHALEYGKRMLGEMAGETVNASFHDMPLENGKFDLTVFSLGLLHSAPDEREQVIREINRTMKEDGLLIITLPSGPTRTDKLASALQHLGFKVVSDATGTANAVGKKDFECVILTAVKVSDAPEERLPPSMFDYDSARGKAESTEAEVTSRIKRKEYGEFTIDGEEIAESAKKSVESMGRPSKKSVSSAKVMLRGMDEMMRLTFLKERYPNIALKDIPKKDLDAMGIELVIVGTGRRMHWTVALKEELSMGSDHKQFAAKAPKGKGQMKKVTR